MLNDLKRKLKDLHYENKKVKTNITTIEKNKRMSEIELEKIMKDKKLIYINGRIEV